MTRAKRLRSRLIYCCTAVLALILEYSTSFAVSSFPPAQIKQVDDSPCFTVVDDSETRKGVRLYSIAVTERESKDWRTRPDVLWAFRMEPPGASIEFRPDMCIRYGEIPQSAKETQKALPLQYNHVYSVTIGARPEGGASSVLGYGSEFCIKPADNEKTLVLEIPWDKKTRRWRYDVCGAP